MSYFNRVFQAASHSLSEKDIGVLKATVLLRLAFKCQDDKMVEVYEALWKGHRDLILTYLDDVYMLQQDIYDCIAEGRDDEIPQLEEMITELEQSFRQVQLLLYDFNKLGIVHR